MKNIYYLLFLFVFTGLSFGQDSLKTEIVFKATDNSSLKVYRIMKKKYIYYPSSYSYYNSDYGSHNHSDFHSHSHYHYPATGVSYQEEYLLTAPASTFLPNNSEISFVVVDNSSNVTAGFITTTDGKRQVWNLVPTGKGYKTGKGLVVLGVAGAITSGILAAIAVSHQMQYKHEMNSYETKKMFQSGYNHFSAPTVTTLSSSIVIDGQSITIPAGTNISLPTSQMPSPPKDNRMGFGVPIICSSISFATILTGLRMISKNSPRAERIE